MSKKSTYILHIVAATLQILQFFTIARPQALDIQVAVNADESKVSVEGRIPDKGKRDRRSLSFIQNYAGIDHIAARIFDVRGWRVDQQPVAVKRFIEGEYAAQSDLSGWGYSVKLPGFDADPSHAHLSWLSNDAGVLFLNDLTPRRLGTEDNSAAVTLFLPEGWKVAGSEKLDVNQHKYDVADPTKAVFVISKDGAIRSFAGKSADLNLSGKWQFSDADLADITDSIIEDYAKLFGTSPKKPQVTIFREPNGAAFGKWEADTRGANVTILSADMPFTSQSVQMLHEQLRHELFHLWFPEGVRLTGNYDWFFEGFALYESLKLGVRQNRISFQDMLDTIGRAYQLDSSQTTRGSLIDASGDRFTAGNSAVYSRGMLAALLCDVALLQSSGGRRSVEDLIREIYRDAEQHPGSSGNDIVLGAMRRQKELIPVVDRTIVSGDLIDLAASLSPAGIKVNGQHADHRLTVEARPDRRQKVILDKLGYNNWRNLSKSSK